MTPNERQAAKTQKAHPDAIVLVHSTAGGSAWYIAFGESATRVWETTGLAVTVKNGTLAMVGFPVAKLGEYLDAMKARGPVVLTSWQHGDKVIGGQHEATA